MRGHARQSKHYQEFGRRLRGGRKASRSGPGKTRGVRRVWYERPVDRCACHGASPCPRASSKAK